MEETSEQRIQRLVNEGIAKAKEEAEAKKKGITDATVNKEFEEKKRKGLLQVSWTNVVSASFLISVMSVVMALLSGMVTTLNGMLIVGVIVFTIIMILMINNRNAMINVYESPESLKIFEEKQRKQRIWGIGIAIVMVIIAWFFVFPVMNSVQIDTPALYRQYPPLTEQNDFQQSANQIAYPSLYPVYNTGTIFEDTDDGKIYKTVLSNGDYTNYIWTASIFTNDNDDPKWLTDVTWYYDCGAFCNNWKTMTSNQIIKNFPDFKNKKITFNERRDNYVEMTMEYTRNGTKMKQFISMTAGQHELIDESYEGTDGEELRELDMLKIAFLILVLGSMVYGILKWRKRNVKN